MVKKVKNKDGPWSKKTTEDKNTEITFPDKENYLNINKVSNTTQGKNPTVTGFLEKLSTNYFEQEPNVPAGTKIEEEG